MAKLILHKVETGAASPYRFKSKFGDNSVNLAGDGVGLQDKKSLQNTDN